MSHPLQFESERLLLRLIEPSDAPAIFEYAKDPAIAHDIGWTPHESVQHTRDCILFWREKGWLTFSIVLKETNTVIGHLGIESDLFRRDLPHVRSLGYALNREFWGNGYMTEAVTAAIRYSFEVLQLRLLTVNHYPFNERSRRVIEKCGFHYDGTLRYAAPQADGSVSDLCCYSMTAEEYAKLKQ